MQLFIYYYIWSIIVSGGAGRDPPLVHRFGGGWGRVRVRGGGGGLRSSRPLRAVRPRQPLHFIHAG